MDAYFDVIFFHGAWSWFAIPLALLCIGYAYKKRSENTFRPRLFHSSPKLRDDGMWIIVRAGVLPLVWHGVIMARIDG
ncbi:hypothetical protein XSR1_10289 [Xenorhabdus szentirmaii DSM 16338]|uniref:Uncharacterized protein n=1 Tax=Xenorhabdus szentirmaii DSM 16338 TaxID=1427518 RepID=W1IQT7_9GAMM|nr:hypothetical protein XSR1_10289 [Xenorhabdus szentirmaii DSM 16338]